MKIKELCIDLFGDYPTIVLREEIPQHHYYIK